jgi:large subunit ribosomal protein L18
MGVKNLTIKTREKIQALKRRRVRKKIRGTSERPRLNVYRSNRHIYVQIIDDSLGRTLASASTLEKELNLQNTGNKEAAKKVGEVIAQRALAKGLQKVVFDRNGFIYHGRVAAVAEGARGKGLHF